LQPGIQGEIQGGEYDELPHKQDIYPYPPSSSPTILSQVMTEVEQFLVCKGELAKRYDDFAIHASELIVSYWTKGKVKSAGTIDILFR
jgi:type 1 glutamine amidotransferase